MTRPGERDRYADFLRAVSLVVVVVWHWAFTILEVSPTTVSPSNPIGYTRGLWAATWVLQVMPVFFFVGGFAHSRAFADYRTGTSRRFLATRIRRLVPPVLALVAVWVAVGVVVDNVMVAPWVWSAVILVLSPLWFIGIYLVLVGLTPVAIRLHWRYGELMVVWLVGIAAVLDVLRFAHGQGWAAWANFFFIWALAHQLGFFYVKLSAASRRLGWAMAWGGLFGLVALTNIGLYPRSVVGVPGEQFSNMGPPTLAIVALIFLQVGLVLAARDAVTVRLQTEKSWQWASRWVNQNSLALFLLHSTGMAVVVAGLVITVGYRPPPVPNGVWWLTRPLWILGPLLATYPFLVLYRRLSRRQTTDDALRTLS